MGLYDLDDSCQGTSTFLTRNPQTCFVAQKSGNIVGVILVGSDGRIEYICHTAVHLEHRRQGIARKLAEKSVASLKKIDIHKVDLVVFEGNQKGNDFLGKAGFYSARRPS